MRNVRISYILAFLFESWFWFGIWIFYYLRFTDYAGVGLAESVMIATRLIAEIPTGAIADLNCDYVRNHGRFLGRRLRLSTGCVMARGSDAYSNDCLHN